MIQYQAIHAVRQLVEFENLYITSHTTNQLICWVVLHKLCIKMLECHVLMYKWPDVISQQVHQSHSQLARPQLCNSIPGMCLHRTKCSTNYWPILNSPLWPELARPQLCNSSPGIFASIAPSAVPMINQFWTAHCGQISCCTKCISDD